MTPRNSSKADVWVIGEALIDIVDQNGKLRRYPGGSPLNVAVGLGRLGDRAVLSTRIGDDAHGDLIADHVNRSGVELAAGSRARGATSTAWAAVSPDGNATYVFDIEWEFSPPSTPIITPIVHTGSLATFLPPGREAVARSILARTDEGAFLSYDPNIRSVLLPNRIDALDSFEEIARKAHLIKVSDADLDYLYPGLDLAGGAELLHTLGAVIVAVTRGAQGSVISSAQGVVHVPAEQVDVVDTVGAGDSWTSGFLHGIRAIGKASDRDITSADVYTPNILDRLGSYAAQCAAVTISRPGANPPTRTDLSYFFDGARQQ